LICLTALIACAPAAPCYNSQRQFVLSAPFEQVVARLVPEENQRRIYLACDAEVERFEQESIEVFPLPLRIRRRARFRLSLPLQCRRLESIERIELTGERMTIRTSLARQDWKVRRLDVMIVLTRDGDQRTCVHTYATLEVCGLGRRFGWLLSDLTVERLECGLRWATQP
jgi:hypothetical protein